MSGMVAREAVVGETEIEGSVACGVEIDVGLPFLGLGVLRGIDHLDPPEQFLELLLRHPLRHAYGCIGGAKWLQE